MSRGGRIIFFSSDAVYGESLEVFDETKALNPAGEYAYMKAEVEKRFSGNKLFKSIRLSYIFSKDDKFVKYLVGCLEGGVSAEIFHPFYRSIIHRDDVSEGVLALVRRWDDFPQQIINFGGPDVLSRVQFAECLKENAMSRLQFHLVEPENGFFEKRPRVIAMSSNYLPMLLGRPSRSLAEAVCIEFK